MTKKAQELVNEGVTEARHGDKKHAQWCFNQVVADREARDEYRAIAHFWLAQFATDVAEKRSHLEASLAFNPQNVQTRQMLAELDGKFDPDKKINADTFEQPDAQQPLHARRFVCPQCGGRMQFAAQTNRLACDYCGHQTTVLRAMQSGMNIEEQDFTVGLATAGGHTKSGDAPQVLTCQGCQATLVSLQQQSLTCPHCGSHHVIAAQSQNLPAPQVMIFFGISQEDARKKLQTWVDDHVIGQQHQTGDVRGVYLPAWTFDVVTEKPWRVMQANVLPSSKLVTSVQTYEGRDSAFHDDVVVPATHRLPYKLLPAYESFDLDALTPYDDACLASYPAALHAITLADASLVARQKAYHIAERQPTSAQAPGNMGAKEAAPSKVSVLSYKLVLLPFWIGSYRYKDKSYNAVVNGQNGKVQGETPPGLLEKALGKVL
ncbi:MAG: hypothetical protein JXA21_18765 [Anaerolineae bacterium]|nr:hypothetical protein [Anaerolineae bacterium]